MGILVNMGVFASAVVSIVVEEFYVVAMTDDVAPVSGAVSVCCGVGCWFLKGGPFDLSYLGE